MTEHINTFVLSLHIAL